MDGYQEKMPHKRKRKKKTPKKSDHKHNYELREIEQWRIENWFTHKEVCTICGKVANRLRIEK